MLPSMHITDTAAWTAAYRALEDEHPEPLFRDPWARALAGSTGFTLLQALPGALLSSWSVVVRTVVLDEEVLAAVAQGASCVVNLGAGYCTRPYRLALPPTLQWVEVDLPQVLAHKHSILAEVKPNCNLQSIPLDLADRDKRQQLFKQLGALGGRVVVLTEGLLMYLHDFAVAELAADLALQPSFSSWVTDLNSPSFLTLVHLWWGGSLQKSAAPIQFAPQQGAAFFAPYGWLLASYRSAWQEGMRLHRELPAAHLWNTMALWAPPAMQQYLHNLAGYAVLRRG